MVKVVIDQKISKAEYTELLSMPGVIDMHVSGNMMAEYEQENEQEMFEAFEDVERLTQNALPCFVDLSGKRSKSNGKESVRDLRRVDIRNLPEKTSVDTVKEAFNNATAVWRNQKQNCFELMFESEEEACEAILSGQQKPIAGTLPWVMFHREQAANLEPTPPPPAPEPTPEPVAKKLKLDAAAEPPNGEAMDGVQETTDAAVEA